MIAAMPRRARLSSTQRAHRLVMAEKQGAHKSAPKVYRAASAYDKATQVQEPIEL